MSVEKKIQEERIAAQQPEGWRLVPVEPTQDMLEAGFSGELRFMLHRERAAYREMLVQAPLPTPQERKPLTDERIKQILDECDVGQEPGEYILSFARAIERAAHGITATGSGEAA